MTITPRISFSRTLMVGGLTLALLSCGSSSSAPAKSGPSGASCKKQSSSAAQSGAQGASGGGAASSGSGNGGTGTGGSGTGADASGKTGSDSGSLQGSGSADCPSKPDFKTNSDGGTGSGK